jgi:hypothetical protein
MNDDLRTQIVQLVDTGVRDSAGNSWTYNAGRLKLRPALLCQRL